MVVGVEQVLAGKLVAPVGHHLVDIHIALGAGTRLPHGEGEVTVQLAGDHLVTGGDDEPGAFLIQDSQPQVRHGGGLFQDSEGVNDRQGDLFAANAEILITPLGLGAPVTVHGDLDLAHGVVFKTKFIQMESTP